MNTVLRMLLGAVVGISLGIAGQRDSDRPASSECKRNCEGKSPKLGGLQELTAKVSAARTIDEGLLAYHKLFRSPLSRERLEALTLNCNPGIAFRAAWEEVLSEVKASDGNSRERLLNPLAVSHFLGFVEGRLRVRVPEWWGSAMYGKILGPKEVRFPRLRVSNYTERLSEPWVYSERHVQVKREAGKVHIATGNGELTLSNEQFDEILRKRAEYGGPPPVLLSCWIGEETWLLAAYIEFGQPYYLYCFSRKGGKPMWTACVWAVLNHPYAFNGRSSQRVSLHVESDRIIVWGLTAMGEAYVEAFKPESGEPIFRCGTAY